MNNCDGLEKNANAIKLYLDIKKTEPLEFKIVLVAGNEEIDKIHLVKWIISVRWVEFGVVKSQV